MTNRGVYNCTVKTRTYTIVETVDTGRFGAKERKKESVLITLRSVFD
ncbi:MAG: hypothetical protein ACI90V_011439 [Bacillariaceae sp.]|jgi:hypothetical protein